MKLRRLSATILAAMLVVGCTQRPAPVPHTGLSEAQKIAMVGGRYVGDFTACGTDTHLVKEIFMMSARAKAADAAESATLEAVYEVGVQFGESEVKSGRRDCKTAEDEFIDLLADYPRHGRRVVP